MRRDDEIEKDRMFVIRIQLQVRTGEHSQPSSYTSKEVMDDIQESIFPYYRVIHILDLKSEKVEKDLKANRGIAVNSLVEIIIPFQSHELAQCMPILVPNVTNDGTRKSIDSNLPSQNVTIPFYFHDRMEVCPEGCDQDTVKLLMGD